jgi:hypothetical protein
MDHLIAQGFCRPTERALKVPGDSNIFIGKSAPTLISLG